MLGAIVGGERSTSNGFHRAAIVTAAFMAIAGRRVVPRHPQSGAHHDGC